MKTLVIGDLHGQHEVVDIALSQGFPVIFLGDYLDSYDRGPEDCILTMVKVLAAVNEGKARALLGNHELSYTVPGMQCSGYNPKTAAMLPAIPLDKFEYYIETEGFLLTHAGVTQPLLDDLEVTLQEYLEGKDHFQIGRDRGGYSRDGGMYWGDWSRFRPVAGVNQIMGHTHGKEIRRKGNNFCIDCIKELFPIKGLLIENGVAEVYTLNQRTVL